MERLGNYELCGQMSNRDSGYSLWCFGRRDSQEYFIKEFLSPKYPYNDTVSSPERLQKKIRRCEEFEAEKKRLYMVLNRFSDGNSVRIRDFFRIGSKYYVVTPKVNARSIPVEDIVAMSEMEKRRICTIIAHSVASFHRGGLIHADLKPTNILFTDTANGSITAKIIDFDSSFLETATPGVGDEIVGDQVYFSPEACMMVCGVEAKLTCKMDVFALGVLFHQYFTGQIPEFDKTQASYPGEAVAKGLKLELSDTLPEYVAQVLAGMLQADPRKRPSALEVFCAMTPEPEPVAAPQPEPVAEPQPKPVVPTGGDGIAESTRQTNPFFRPGDL